MHGETHMNIMRTLKKLVAPWEWPRFKAETCRTEYKKYKIVQYVHNINVCVVYVLLHLFVRVSF